MNNWIQGLLVLVTATTSTGVTLPQCTGPTPQAIEMTEDVSGQTIRCDGTGQSGIVDWLQITSTGESNLVTCTAPNDCQAAGTVFTATRDSTSSTLTVGTSAARPFGNLTLRCRVASDDVTCQLDVVNGSNVTCRAQYNTDGPEWTVSGSCTITKAFSYHDRYNCLWFYTHNADEAKPIPSSQTSHSTPSQLPGTNTKPYYNFTCSFSRPFPTEAGTYSYSATVYPGAVNTPAIFSGSSTIADPATPSPGCPTGYIKVGTTLTCTCSTTNPGSPPATVAWRGQSDARLQVPSVTSSINNKTYTCEMRRGNTVIKNTTYTLRVAYGPSSVSVTGPTLPFDTDGHQEMTLTCTSPASTYNPSLTYAWRRSPSSPAVVTPTASFTFTVSAQDDGKEIMCTASNSQYNDIQAEDTFLLDVHHPPITDPVITINSSDLYQGDPVTLTCTVTGGKPVNATTVNFTCTGKTDSPDTPVGSNAISSSVTFDSLSGQDKQCTCNTKWKQTDWYTRSEPRQVSFNTPPSPPVIRVPSTGYPFIAGEGGTLTCVSSDPGRPEAKYTWPVTGGGRPDEQRRGTLTFDMVSKEDDGKTVRCKASNLYTVNRQPVADYNLTLQVYYKPDITIHPLTGGNQCDVNSDPTSCEITEGQGLHINCTSDSNPAPASTVWKKDGAVFIPSSILSIDVTNHTVHNGQYSCHVTTGNLTGHPGREPLTAAYILTVFVKYSTALTHLTVNSQPHNVTVNERDTVYMECRADGRPTPTMSLVNTDSGQEKNHTEGGHVTLEDRDSWLTYTLHQADCQDAGVYVCTAGNDVNNAHTTHNVTLFVNCKPKPLTDVPEANYKGLAVDVSVDLVSYPVPNTFRFSYLGPQENDLNNVADVTDNRLTMRCWPTSTVYLATCNITIDNMTESDAGYYNVRIGNAHGSSNVRFRVLFNETKMEPLRNPWNPPYGAIGGGIVAVVFLAAAVIGVIIFFRRKTESSCRGVGQKKKSNGISQDMKKSNFYSPGAKDDEDEVMIVNDVYGSSDRLGAASDSTGAAPVKTSAYEDVDITSVNPTIQPSTSEKGKDVYSVVDKGNKKTTDVPEDKTYTTVNKGQSTSAASKVKPDVKPKPPTPTKQAKPQKQKKKKETRKEKGVVHGNMPLSMKPMDGTVYENFAFNSDETTETSGKYPKAASDGGSANPTRDDALVYTTIQFTENQLKKAEEPPPTRETTEYVSIAFDRHVPPMTD